MFNIVIYSIIFWARTRTLTHKKAHAFTFHILGAVNGWGEWENRKDRSFPIGKSFTFLHRTTYHHTHFIFAMISLFLSLSFPKYLVSFELRLIFYAVIFVLKVTLLSSFLSNLNNFVLRWRYTHKCVRLHRNHLVRNKEKITPNSKSSDTTEMVSLFYVHTFPKRNKKKRKKMNLWTKMKYNAGQNAGWHACMYSHNIQSRRCFLNARGFVYRPSTLFSVHSFVRSFDYYNTWYVPKSRYVICSILVWIYIQHNFFLDLW